MITAPHPTKLDPIVIANQLLSDHSLSFLSYPKSNGFAHTLIDDRHVGTSRGLQDVALAKTITRSASAIARGANNWQIHGPGAMNYYDSVAFRAIEGRSPDAGIVCSYHSRSVIYESIGQMAKINNDGVLTLQVLWHLSQHSTEHCHPVQFNCVPIVHQGIDTMASVIYIVGGR